MSILGVADWAASSLWRGRKRRQFEQEAAALRARGVTAPAVVVSAKHRGERSSDDGQEIRIRYTVDVHPPQAQPFRAEFDHWSQRRGYTAIMGEIQGEAGTHVWVTFDPADPSQMLYECTEAERVARAAEEQLEVGRGQFNAIAEPLEPLRTAGAPAEALIVLAEDLGLPYPRRQSTAMRLHVDVTPPGAATYRAAIPALITVTSLGKYSAGRRVYVRVDPRDPQRVVLDSERNRSLPA